MSPSNVELLTAIIQVAVAVVSWRLLSAGNSQAEQDDNLTTVTTEEQEDPDNSDFPQDEDSQKRFPFLQFSVQDTVLDLRGDLFINRFAAGIADY